MHCYLADPTSQPASKANKFHIITSIQRTVEKKQTIVTSVTLHSHGRDANPTSQPACKANKFFTQQQTTFMHAGYVQNLLNQKLTTHNINILLAYGEKKHIKYIIFVTK